MVTLRMGGWQMKQNLNTIKDQVEDILRTYPQARNDDRLLVLLYWKHQGVNLDIPYDIIDSLVSPESIRRVRQKLQNEDGIFPPTNFEIIRKRGLREQQVRNWALGGKNE